MVLALGAKISPRGSERAADYLDKWAEYLWAHSNNYSALFQESSLKGTHFLLLKVGSTLTGFAIVTNMY